MIFFCQSLRFHQVDGMNADSHGNERIRQALPKPRAVYAWDHGSLIIIFWWGEMQRGFKWSQIGETYKKLQSFWLTFAF